MGRLDRLPYHGRTHLPGGTDPIPGLSLSGGGTELGPWHQSIPLKYYDAITEPPGWDYSGFQWTTDAAFAGGGYVGATTDASYFTCLVQLAPKGSVWHINYRAAIGPDFGRFTFALASLEYESASRPSGDTTGKISPVDGSYGTFTYVPVSSPFTFDAYGATDLGDTTIGSSPNFIVGGDAGDPLTTMDIGPNDPMLGFALMDGGPGWYRLKCYVDGQNASSSGYKTRISEILLNRRADDNAP